MIHTSTNMVMWFYLMRLHATTHKLTSPPVPPSFTLPHYNQCHCHYMDLNEDNTKNSLLDAIAFREPGM